MYNACTVQVVLWCAILYWMWDRQTDSQTNTHINLQYLHEAALVVGLDLDDKFLVLHFNLTATQLLCLCHEKKNTFLSLNLLFSPPPLPHTHLLCCYKQYSFTNRNTLYLNEHTLYFNGQSLFAPPHPYLGTGGQSLLAVQVDRVFLARGMVVPCGKVLFFPSSPCHSLPLSSSSFLLGRSGSPFTGLALTWCTPTNTLWRARCDHVTWPCTRVIAHAP